jgi:hypothetical protein
MKTILRFLMVALLSWLGTTAAFGSHIYGGDIIYACINSCTVRVNLNCYRSCTGNTMIDSSNLAWRGAPGCVAPPALGAWSARTVTEITGACPSTVTGCNMPGAPIGGFQQYAWSWCSRRQASPPVLQI